MNELTHGEVRRLFDYDSALGILRWKVRVRRSWAPGSIAGSERSSKGYGQVGIRRRYYRLHQLVWFWVYGEWPVGELDHIDRDPTNNRIENLRVATDSQQSANRGNTRPGRLKGAYERKGKWRSGIRVDGMRKWLGTFDTEEEAHEAYGRAAREHFGEYACLG